MEKEEYIFGTRAVIEAIKAGRPVDKILIKKGGRNELQSELVKLAKDFNIPFQFVPTEKINRISRKNHQGVLAFLSPVEFQRIENVLPEVFEKGQNPLLLILDRITDVRNFGAIVRTADCAGVHAVIIPEKGMARISGDAVKTSAGAIHNIPICRETNLIDTISYLKESGLKVIAASEKAVTVYTEIEMNVPLALILGSEDRGVAEPLLNAVDSQVRIPILGSISSLNVSVAAALMVYEAVRQKIN